MSISLNNHEERVKDLENRISQQVKECNNSQNGYIWFNNGLMVQWYTVTKAVHLGWTWIDFPTSFTQKPFTHFGQLVTTKANNSQYTSNHNIDWARTTNKGAYMYHASSYWDGYFEIKCLTIGLKIYYIFRYNIREILKLISPILKF